ncbi:MAG: hypothetical protein JSS66_15475 [Armatimonadetes bacterium]|nr:hypothetical protein [Armatimonadota bacterium]
MLLVALLLMTAEPDFTFSGTPYFHRYSKDNLHEYTPKDQTVDKWSDMMTFNVYSQVKDGEALATSANNVLGAYKEAKAIVVKTDSVPRTESKPAEHLIVVLFPQPAFIEAAFARFKMHEGHGVSLVYSHRIYGAKAGDAMSEWLKGNGARVEKALMDWKAVPKSASKPKGALSCR